MNPDQLQARRARAIAAERRGGPRVGRVPMTVEALQSWHDSLDTDDTDGLLIYEHSGRKFEVLGERPTNIPGVTTLEVVPHGWVPAYR
jgi:hypothetical protein